MKPPRFPGFSAATLASALTFLAAVSWAQQKPRVVLFPYTVAEFGLKNNTAVQSLHYSVNSAEYSRKSALAGFLPTVKGKASYIHLNEAPTIDMSFGSATGEQPSDPATLQLLQMLQSFFPSGPITAGPQDMWDIGLSVTQPLFTGGKVYNGYMAAKYSHAGMAHTWERTREEIGLAGVRLFWNYVSTIEALRSLDGSLSWLEKLATDQTALFDAGMIIEDDLYRIRTQVSLMRLNRQRTADGIESLGRAILLFCSLPLETELVVDSSSYLALDTEVQVPQPDFDLIINNRADIRAVECQIEALKSLKKVQLGAYSPNLFAAYNYDFKNSDVEKVHELTGEWNVGVFLDWTLFDWGKGWRDVQKTGASIAQLMLSLDTKKREMETQILDICRRIAQAAHAQELAREGAVNARRTLQRAELRYTEGAITGTELLSARSELTGAELELIKARIDKVLALEEYNTIAGDTDWEKKGKR